MLNEPTYLVHDYETFGKNPALDRPAQFASLRVNKDLRILSKPQVFLCSPANDYLPDPEAVLIHGITPQQTLRDGVIESAFARRIHQLFNTPNTCILGYNNISFDDEFSRHLFYRNFYDPYSWSWQKGNSRWDILNIVRACYALRPEGIKWPSNDKGQPSFRLEDLTLANGIKHYHAHDAMSDVYATLAIAKLIRQMQPKLFDYFYQYRRKQQLKLLIDISAMKPLIYISAIFGLIRSNIALVAPLAWHPANPNAIIVCDLSGDVQILANLDNDILRSRLYTKYNDTMNHDTNAVPLQIIYLNKCPALAPAHTLRTLDAERLGIKIKHCINNLIWLRKQSGLKEKIIMLFNETKHFTSSEDVDAQLYDAFFSRSERTSMELILSTPPEHIRSLEKFFTDPRLQPLLFRYRARNFPSTLNQDEHLKWLQYRKTRFNQKIIESYLDKLKILSVTHKNCNKKTHLLNKLYLYVHEYFIH
nr:exodeoxyribonuclease I [secondary endosymbiont of Heteropsylla cubana]